MIRIYCRDQSQRFIINKYESVTHSGLSLGPRGEGGTSGHEIKTQLRSIYAASLIQSTSLLVSDLVIKTTPITLLLNFSGYTEEQM